MPVGCMLAFPRPCRVRAADTICANGCRLIRSLQLGRRPGESRHPYCGFCLWPCGRHTARQCRAVAMGPGARPGRQLSKRHVPTISRRALRPSYSIGPALFKTEGTGNAGSWPPPWPACNKKCRRQVPQVQPRHPGIPRAMGGTAASRSPRCSGLFGHRRS